MGWAANLAAKRERETQQATIVPQLAPQQELEKRAGFRAYANEPVRTENPDPVGPVDAAMFATIEDPLTRIKKYAQARFPNDPNALSRYGMMNEEVVYRADDGKIYNEVSGTASTVGNFMGETALPIAGAILGTLFAGPPGGAIMGMGGLSLRKLLGLSQGDQQTEIKNSRDLMTGGIIDYVVPGAAAKLSTGWANRLAAKDLVKFDLEASTRLQASARKVGITLTPAELTKLGSLINQQNRYSAGMDPAGDVMSKFYGERGEQIARVMDDFLGGAKDLDVVGASARNVAKQSIDDAQAAVDTGSKSFYTATVSKENLVPERAFMEIDADPLINKYINQVKDNPVSGLMDAPRNSTAVIDAAGKLLRQESKKAGIAGGDFDAGQYSAARKKLLRFMEKSFPAYKEARTVQATTRATQLDPLKDGVEGIIAKLKDTNLYTVPDKLLSSKGVSPASVANWRRQFISQGKEKEWDQLVNAYLRQVWEGKATKGRTVKALSGARFSEMVFGTPGQKKILREALGKKRFNAFSDLMEVLEATGTASRGQSMTQPAQEAAKEEARQIAPIVSRLGDVSAVRPQQVLTTWWMETKQSNWRESMAKVITSPEAVKELEKLRILRRLSPRSQRKFEVVAQALEKAGVVYFKPSAESAQ